MTTLLFAISAVTLTVVVVLCILLYRQSKKQKKSTVITENMVAEMLKKEGYQVVEVKISPDSMLPAEEWDLKPLIFSLRKKSVLSRLVRLSLILRPITALPVR